MSLSEDIPLRPARPWVGYAGAVALVAGASWIAVLIDHMAGASNLALVFVLPVVIAAVGFGWGPSLVAAVLGVAAFNFLLVEPRHTFRVTDAADVAALGLLLVVAAIVSTVAAQARRRAVEAARRADQALALHGLARALAGATDRAAIGTGAAEALARLFQAPAAVLVADAEVLEPVALAGGASLSEADREAARWAVASNVPTRARAWPVEEAAFDFWPVVTPARRRAAVGLRLADARPAEPERLVEIVTGYLAVALARDDYAAQALETKVEVERERLKADLLAAVSHDLKTPLSTILFTLQSLRRFEGVHDPAARAELLTLAETETARLAGLVGNLLDMSRLDAGAVLVQRAPVAPADLARAALARAERALAGRRVVNRISARAPLVLADAALAETALANVLENAGKYAPAGSAVTLTFDAADGRGAFRVTDEGPGFAGPAEPLFEKFARGVEGDGRPPGTGLGLSIARGFLEAQGGRIAARDREDRAGAEVVLELPLAQPLTEPA